MGQAYNESVLVFELLPVFMTVVSILIAVGLYVSNRRSRNDPPDPVITVTPPSPSDKTVQPNVAFTSAFE